MDEEDIISEKRGILQMKLKTKSFWCNVVSEKLHPLQKCHNKAEHQ